MSPDDTTNKLHSLTTRQLEILKLVCEDLTYKQIGEKLFLAEGTIKIQMSNIYEKLDLDEIKNRQKRRNLLHQVYCSTLKEIEIHPRIPEKEEDIPPAHPPKKVMKMVEEDEKAIIVRPSNQSNGMERDPDQKSKINPTKRLRWFLFGAVVGSLFL